MRMGRYEIYDIGANAIIAPVGANRQFAGLGLFFWQRHQRHDVAHQQLRALRTSTTESARHYRHSRSEWQRPSSATFTRMPEPRCSRRRVELLCLYRHVTADVLTTPQGGGKCSLGFAMSDDSEVSTNWPSGPSLYVEAPAPPRLCCRKMKSSFCDGHHSGRSNDLIFSLITQMQRRGPRVRRPAN
jgi:hypothetical protein